MIFIIFSTGITWSVSKIFVCILKSFNHFKKHLNIVRARLKCTGLINDICCSGCNMDLNCSATLYPFSNFVICVHIGEQIDLHDVVLSKYKIILPGIPPNYKMEFHPVVVLFTAIKDQWASVPLEAIRFVWHQSHSSGATLWVRFGEVVEFQKH